MKLYKIILLLIAANLISGCEKKEESSLSRPAFEIQNNDSIPSFNGENAYAMTKVQVDFGPRNPGSTGHTLALSYLQNELNRYADDVKLQSFSYAGYNEELNLTNIIAQFNPGNRKQDNNLCSLGFKTTVGTYKRQHQTKPSNSRCK